MFTSLKKSFMKAKQAVKDVGKVIIIAIGVGFMLGGCGTTVKTEVVKESSYYHPSVPEKLFVRVVPERPISKEQYLAMSTWERESYLTNYNISLLKNVATCNRNVSDIKNVLDEAKRVANNEGKSANK